MTRYVYFFGQGQADGDGKQKELLGGKGAGLAEMTRLGIPVPPGFTLTTDVARSVMSTGDYPAELEAQRAEALARVESIVGATFGDPERPLLVSVRSGARASMPGMMDTILNLGLNDRVTEGLARATGNAKFAWDAYRRFVTMYADVVLGVPRSLFEVELTLARQDLAKERGLPTGNLNEEELRRKLPDSELDAERLKALAHRFIAIVEKQTGKPFPTDPHEQLAGAIRAVFQSWNNHRAKVYRKMHGIPDEWGTACTVQAMVFGNLGDDSCTGVAFTRDPSTGEARFFGEWLPNAQGEDVVAGIRTPQPLAVTADSLEAKHPELYGELVGIRDRLEKHFRDMQDLEFTIQRGKLFLLQCRNGKRAARAAVRMAVEMVREGLITKEEAILRVEPSSLDQLLHPTLDPAAAKRRVARGLPASPGAASGAVVFSADDAEKKDAQGIAVILVRTETSPEDVHGMKAARGVLTSRGGMTSHAAVVARGMGKCCVAGCSAISVDYQTQSMTIAVYDDAGKKIDTAVVKAGETITLDGSTGAVFLGAVPTVPAQLSGDFGELMGWADGVRRLRVRANADNEGDARTARNYGAEGIGLCRTEHMFFDDQRILAMREMIVADDRPARELALAKLLPYQKGDFVGIFQAMAGLPVTIRLLDPPLHEFLPDNQKQWDELAKITGTTPEHVKSRVHDLHEANPMLGHRGCRLAITFPEIYAMQVRAILEAAIEVSSAGVDVQPEIMIPLALSRPELARMKALVDEVAADVFAKAGRSIPWHFGTMIELPRAALVADQLAEVAEFFSFGTNDLTQTTMGLSRDDAGKFLGAYVDGKLMPSDPFQSLDTEGVGQLVTLACERGKKTRANIKLGVCGEHGGDPASIQFFHGAGLAYVSCSPFRVPIARLAAAQASLQSSGAKGSSTM